MSVNSEHFDLTNWKLTLPVDKAGTISGRAAEVADLNGFEDPRSFFDDDTGAMVFRVSVDGATTGGSKYPRSELREMDGDDRAAWTLSEGGTMSATLTVQEAPTLDKGGLGRIVVGQIHGSDDELVRLYWDNGSVYFKNDQAGPSDKELKFTFTASDGSEPDIALGERFSYVIEARGETLAVSIFADGKTYTSVTRINDVWQSDALYFKAGAYLGVNETNGDGFGQVAFHGLDFSHEPGRGLGGLVSAPSEGDEVVGGGQVDPATEPAVDVVDLPVDEPPKVSEEGETFAGTSGNNALTGGHGNDTFYGRRGDDVLDGGGGDDVIWGNSGQDTLIGGAGDDWLKGGDGIDTFVFEAGHGHDIVHEFRRGETLKLSDTWFASRDDVLDALVRTDDGLLLKTGTVSSILFTNTSERDLMGGTIELETAASPTNGAGDSLLDLPAGF